AKGFIRGLIKKYAWRVPILAPLLIRMPYYSTSQLINSLFRHHGIKGFDQDEERIPLLSTAFNDIPQVFQETQNSRFQSKGEPSTSDSPFPYSSSANESDAISLGDEMSIGIVNFESHKGIYGLLGLCVIGTPASGLELECDRICFLLLGKTSKRYSPSVSRNLG
ncbi:hypothetical protein CCACVL1_03218, partial [Corchorus capsularis]